jgi:hypothetical protein
LADFGKNIYFEKIKQSESGNFCNKFCEHDFFAFTKFCEIFAFSNNSTTFRFTPQPVPRRVFFGLLLQDATYCLRYLAHASFFIRCHLVLFHTVTWMLLKHRQCAKSLTFGTNLSAGSNHTDLGHKPH